MNGWFTWNGVDSRTMGVVVTEYPPVVYPTERAETVSIPGRRGFLTRTEGRHIYDGYLKTVGIGNRRSADPQAIARWLRGSGELVLGSEPGFVYYARVLKEASLERVMPGVYSGEVGFMVQPGKGRCPPEGDRIWRASQTEAGATWGRLQLYNPGDLPAAPLITVSAAGPTEDTGPTIRMCFGAPGADETTLPRLEVDLSSRTDLTGCVIDLDAMRVTSLDGSESLDVNVTLFNAADALLRLEPGQTTEISWALSPADYDTVTVRPRWRWL